MNKLQTQALALLNQHDASQDLNDAIIELLGTSKKAEKHPDYIEDGITYKYCSRHEAYHNINEWTARKNGSYDHNCDLAVKQWKAFTKDIRGLEKLTMGIINDPEGDLQKHMLQIESIKTQRLAKYDYATTVPTADEPAVKPARKSKKA